MSVPARPSPGPEDVAHADGFESVWLRPNERVLLRRLPGLPVGIVREADSHRLVAVHDIPEGTRLFSITGEPSARPSRYSVQVGEGLHLAPGPGTGGGDPFAEHFWRFLNHSCDPNVLIRDRSVLTLRPIAAGQDLAFDYHTTEYDMDEPFTCHCASPDCLGTIRGFRHLNREQQLRLRPLLPPWLAKHLASDPSSGG